MGWMTTTSTTGTWLYLRYGQTIALLECDFTSFALSKPELSGPIRAPPVTCPGWLLKKTNNKEQTKKGNPPIITPLIFTWQGHHCHHCSCSAGKWHSSQPQDSYYVRCHYCNITRIKWVDFTSAKLLLISRPAAHDKMRSPNRRPIEREMTLESLSSMKATPFQIVPFKHDVQYFCHSDISCFFFIILLDFSLLSAPIFFLS